MRKGIYTKNGAIKIKFMGETIACKEGELFGYKVYLNEDRGIAFPRNPEGVGFQNNKAKNPILVIENWDYWHTLSVLPVGLSNVDNFPQFEIEGK